MMYSLRMFHFRNGAVKAAISSELLNKSQTSISRCQAIVTTTATSAASSKMENESFWEKNARLKRPMSPHLTIYKPQLTSLLSLTHRGTGLGLATCLSGFSIGMLALPGSFPHYLSMIESMHFGSGLIFLAKFGLSFTFTFHLVNGIRHLFWDLGYGFSLRTLYKSGYLVVGTSIVLASMIAAL